MKLENNIEQENDKIRNDINDGLIKNKKINKNNNNLETT